MLRRWLEILMGTGMAGCVVLFTYAVTQDRKRSENDITNNQQIAQIQINMGTLTQAVDKLSLKMDRQAENHRTEMAQIIQALNSHVVEGAHSVAAQMITTNTRRIERLEGQHFGNPDDE